MIHRGRVSVHSLLKHGVSRPPKAQPAPGNAQASRTATRVRTSGKPTPQGAAPTE
jgi:hypothetical protein